ncbi:glutamate-5-semialdehyde dehydrogenase [Pedobacter sp. CG_S7]|uniref:glutamate-5-semialdehyde dehydrogenase n=1 Tax=Pedobacter sp. CG_S7 TaxID=3143930 RepID=UPI0033972884
MEYQIYFQNSLKAKKDISLLTNDEINKILLELADAVEESIPLLIKENQKDLDQMSDTDPKYDRLKLTAVSIAAISSDIRKVAKLPNPLGVVLSEQVMPNGLHISKVRVPLGIVGVIYEARPNVTLDVFTLCFKTGNVCILKGGSDAEFSNQAIISVIHQVLNAHNLNSAFVTLLPSERAATHALLQARGFVDVLIPRGSQQLINYVRESSKIPVIETGAGIVHVYFDAQGDLNKGKGIIFNAKTRRVSVCNALDCLLVHQDRLNDLPELLQPLIAENVTLFADDAAFSQLKNSYPGHLLQVAKPEHYGTEFLDYKLAVKTVEDINEALNHIAENSSKHSEAIVSENPNHIALFLNQVDAAAVYANASTAFTDGGQFGLGAEIGISTQKLHARGPMGLEELTSYKWLVWGEGQIR